MSRKAQTSCVVLDPQVEEIEYEATADDYLGDYDEQLAREASTHADALPIEGLPVKLALAAR